MVLMTYVDSPVKRKIPEKIYNFLELVPSLIILKGYLCVSIQYSPPMVSLPYRGGGV
jgi:hypothetical protein